MRCAALARRDERGDARRETHDLRPGAIDSRFPTPDARLPTVDPRIPTPESRIPNARLRSPSRRVVPYALAASLVTIVGGAFLYQATAMSPKLMAAQLVADHERCFSGVGGDTRALASVVEQSLASTFDWRVHLPDGAAARDLELVGERTCLYGDGRVAHIMYRHQGQPMSLFMLPHSEHAAGAHRGLRPRGGDLVREQPHVRPRRARAAQRGGTHGVVRPNGATLNGRRVELGSDSGFAHASRGLNGEVR